MITPSYSVTATERVLPKLALDFTSGVLDSRITFTRTTDATHPATYVNSSGIITAATDNQARFDYDPITLACNGLLVEESRANSYTYSEDFSQSIWSKNNASVNTFSVVNPAGGSSTYKLIEDTSTAVHFLNYPISTVSGTKYTQSYYVKAAERNKVALFFGASGFGVAVLVLFDLVAVSATVVTGTATTSITAVGNGWYRISVSALASATNVAVNTQFRLAADDGNTSYAGNGTSGAYLWGAQVEVGAFPTSYIPTTSAALTRNADVATMTGTNFSSWFNATEGTFQSTYDSLLPLGSGSSVACVMQSDKNVDDNDAICLLIRQSSSDVILRVKVGGANQAAIGGSTTTNTKTTINGAYKLDSFAASVNASTPATDSSGSIPTGQTTLRLGSQTAGQYLNGHLYKLSYWPQRLINNEIQAFSKG